MLTSFRKWLNRSLVRFQESGEVARFDNIIISDTQENALFRDTVLLALQLIKEGDPRRFHRVQRYIEWVVNCGLPFGGGQYHYATRTCRLDFEVPKASVDLNYLVGVVVRTLVHEATHGRVEACGIAYNTKMRSRIERCCYEEEQRSIARIFKNRPALARVLSREFTESRWDESWGATRMQSFYALLARFCPHTARPSN